ncbi:MAG: hypothetical protein ACXABY_01740 [Candidatus Thorarchaeota archaeon]|jgi:hypothetical protein
MILLNSDITSTVSSGIDGRSVSHVLFVPQAEDPSLPSGNVWMRANDGQVERLAVTGTSGILECRNAEGFAFYSSTTTQDLSAGPVIISGYTTIVQDDRFMNLTGSNTVIAHVGGLHRLSYTVTYINASNRDGSVNAQILINGTKLDGSEMASYMPNAADGGQCTVAFYGMAILSVGDEIQIQAEELSGEDFSVDSAILNVELIRPRGAL